MATIENQALEVERSLPSVGGQPSAHPCMVDPPAASKVRLGDGETTVQDSQLSNEDKLPGIDVSQQVGLVETTVDIPEGRHVQQDVVGVDNDGNQRVRPPRRNPRHGKQSDS